MMISSTRRSAAGAREELYFFPLEEVLGPGKALVVYIEQPFVSLVTTGRGAGDNPVLKQRRLRQSELRILLSLLVSSGYCSDEVLLASLNCPWECLLDGLFTYSTSQLQAAVSAHREVLQSASDSGTWADTLKPLYNVLYTLRPKIGCFGLWVDSSPCGYSLVPFPASSTPL